MTRVIELFGWVGIAKGGREHLLEALEDVAPRAADKGFPLVRVPLTADTRAAADGLQQVALELRQAALLEGNIISVTPIP